MTGGKNRRMNGEKKLFLEYKGKSFLENILNVLQSIEKIYLSVEDEAPYRHLQLPMIVDEISQIGPIGGIYSGLKNCQEEALLVVACDMPFISSSAIDRLVEHYRTAVNQDGLFIAFAEGKVHPLLGIYPRTILPYVEKQIEEQDYKMMHLLEKVGYTLIELAEDDYSTVNINTVEEYKMLCSKK